MVSNFVLFPFGDNNSGNFYFTGIFTSGNHFLPNLPPSTVSNHVAQPVGDPAGQDIANLKGGDVHQPLGNKAPGALSVLGDETRL